MIGFFNTGAPDGGIFRATLPAAGAPAKQVDDEVMTMHTPSAAVLLVMAGYDGAASAAPIDAQQRLIDEITGRVTTAAATPPVDTRAPFRIAVQDRAIAIITGRELTHPSSDRPTVSVDAQAAAIRSITGQ